MHFYCVHYISYDKLYQIKKYIKSLTRFCHRDEDQPFQTTQKGFMAKQQQFQCCTNPVQWKVDKSIGNLLLKKQTYKNKMKVS